MQVAVAGVVVGFGVAMETLLPVQEIHQGEDAATGIPERTEARACSLGKPIQERTREVRIGARVLVHVEGSCNFFQAHVLIAT